MAGEDEILRYKFYISDAEAKTNRLIELQKEIVEGKAAEGDTSELERQFGREADALAKLGQEEKKGVSSAEELTRQKEKLGAVVRTLGGNYSGLMCDLGGVVELLTSGSKAAIGFGSALAAITVGVVIYQKLADSANAFAEAQERANKALLEQKLQAVDPGTDVRNTLERLGAIDKLQDANQLIGQLQERFGFDAAWRGRAAPLGAAAGRSLKQTALLSTILEQGATPGSAEDVQRLVHELEADPATLQRAERTLGEIAQSGGGLREQARADVVGRLGPLTPIERLYAALQETGRLPAGVERAEDLLNIIEPEHVREARRQLAFQRANPVPAGYRRLGDRPAPTLQHMIGKFESQRTDESRNLELLLRDLEAAERGGRIPEGASVGEFAPGRPLKALADPFNESLRAASQSLLTTDPAEAVGLPPGSLQGATINIHNETHNTGNIQNSPDRWKEPSRTRVGASKMDHRVGHG